MSELKPTVNFEDSFDLLDIRAGRVLSVEPAVGALKASYLIRADFGKFGVRQSVARLTSHPPDELVGKTICGVLNFPPRTVGENESQFLILGIQVQKLDSGEATPLVPLNPSVKIGSKIF